MGSLSDHSIRSWDSRTGRPRHPPLRGVHTSTVHVLDPHPWNPDIAMSAGYDGQTVIWDLGERAEEEDEEGGSGVTGRGRDGNERHKERILRR